MGKGRPSRSIIRERIGSILAGCGVAYGYQISKIYENVYEPSCLRSIYYNLKKGCQDGLFAEIGIVKEKGCFTWGNSSERRYYILGPNSNAVGDELVVKTVNELGFKYINPDKFVDWDILGEEKLEILLDKVEDLSKKLVKGNDREELKVEYDKLYNNYSSLLDWLKDKGNLKLKEKVAEEIKYCKKYF